MVEFTNFGFFKHVNPGKVGEYMKMINEDGVDYYDLLRDIMDHEGGVVTETIYGAWVTLELDGKVRNVYPDPSALVPANAYVLGVDMDPDEIYDGLEAMYWDEETTTFLAPPPPPPPPIPDLTPRQFELMLRQIGMTADDVVAQIEAMPDAEDRAIAKIEFRRATVFERNHWAVGPIATAFGFSSDEMDTMWRYAASI